MELKPYDPWSEFEKVRQEVDRTFERFLAKLRKAEPGRDIAFLPTADVVETAEDYRIFLSIPGVAEEDIDLTIEKNVLIVRGEREPPYDPERVRQPITEWRYGIFERQIRLPVEVDPGAINANYRAGVLTVLVPKPSGGS